jgi:hypothetical protein
MGAVTEIILVVHSDVSSTKIDLLAVRHGFIS